MADELTDAPYKPDEDLWEDVKIPQVPEWAEEPEVPATPTAPRCAIPMCGDSGLELLRLGCAHHLHVGCISKIFKATRNPQCPMCRDDYLSRIRQIVETSPFGVAAPASPFIMPDTYGPPDPPFRPPNATRYGEQFDPTPRGSPISYGGRFRHQDRHNANQHMAETGPPPQPAIGKVNMMGLEARQFLR